MVVLSVWAGSVGLPALMFLPGTMTHPLFYAELPNALNRRTGSHCTTTREGLRSPPWDAAASSPPSPADRAGGRMSCAGDVVVPAAFAGGTATVARAASSLRNLGARADLRVSHRTAPSEGRADWRVRVGNKCPGASGLPRADWRGTCRTGPRQRHRGGTVILMMWGYGAGWGWGAWLTMGIGMILFWGLVIGGGIVLIRYLAGTRYQHPPRARPAGPGPSRSWPSGSPAGTSTRTSTGGGVSCCAAAGERDAPGADAAGHRRGGDRGGPGSGLDARDRRVERGVPSVRTGCPVVPRGTCTVDRL